MLVATVIVLSLSGISASADAPRPTGIPTSVVKGRQEKGSIPFRSAVERYYGGVRTDAIGKIIGGKIASWNDHQWQAALLVSWIADPVNAQFCGGSLIYEDKWVVTAAHCVYDKDYNATISTEAVYVLTGTADLSSGGKRSNVEAIYVHEYYNPRKYDNDIALLKLKESGKGKSITLITEKEEPSIVVSNRNAIVTFNPAWPVPP